MENLIADLRSWGPLRLAAFVVAASFIVPGSVLGAGGDLDPVFGAGAGPGQVFTTLMQPDGKVIISGNFTTYNGTPRDGLARVNPDGSLDPTFAPPAVTTDTGVGSMALQLDGRILIGGGFHTFNGISRKGIARLNANGSLDPTFDPGTGVDFPPLIDEGSVDSFSVQPDKKIIITGDFIAYGGMPRHRIARLNPDGSLDTSFPAGGAQSGGSFTEALTTTALQPDGKILIAGEFTSYGGTPRNGLARLNADGSLDPTFATGLGIEGSRVETVALQSDGKIVIAGDFFSYNGTPRRCVARVNANGSLDPSFDPGALITGGEGLALALQPDGKILFGGYELNAGTPGAHATLARLNPNGTRDGTFDTGTGTFDTDASGNDRLRTISLQRDGQVIIGGVFQHYKGVARNGIARLLPAPGAISFSSANYSVGEGAGNATITLTRTGGTDTKVVAKISLADVTTSPADYVFGGIL